MAAVYAGMSYLEAGNTYGIAEATIKHWMNPEMAPGSATAVPPPKYRIDDAKLHLAQQFEDIAFKLLGYANQKADSGNLLQTMTSAAIAVDKMRLLREQSTQNTRQEVIVTEEERDAKLIEILSAVKERLMTKAQTQIEGDPIIDVEPIPTVDEKKVAEPIDIPGSEE